MPSDPAAEGRPAHADRAALTKKRTPLQRLGDAAKVQLDYALFDGFRRLPIGMTSAIGGRIATLRGPTHYRIALERAAENMRRLRPDWSEDEIAAAGLKRWDNIGRLMAEYAILDRIVATGRAPVEGAEHLWAVQASGKGCILMGVHLSNWELSSPILTGIGAPPTTFYEPQPSPSRENIARKVRERNGATLLPPGRAGIKPALEALRAGVAVAVFVDEVRDGVVQTPFFGRPVHADSNLGLIARLARKADVPVVPGYVLREDHCRFSGHILPAIHLPPEDGPGARLLDDVRLLNDVFEPLILAHLDQWYYLHFKL